jgi:hypothetical protein
LALLQARSNMSNPDIGVLPYFEASTRVAS